MDWNQYWEALLRDAKARQSEQREKRETGLIDAKLPVALAGQPTKRDFLKSLIREIGIATLGGTLATVCVQEWNKREAQDRIKLDEWSVRDIHKSLFSPPALSLLADRFRAKGDAAHASVCDIVSAQNLGGSLALRDVPVLLHRFQHPDNTTVSDAFLRLLQARQKYLVGDVHDALNLLRSCTSPGYSPLEADLRLFENDCHFALSKPDDLGNATWVLNTRALDSASAALGQHLGAIGSVAQAQKLIQALPAQGMNLVFSSLLRMIVLATPGDERADIVSSLFGIQKVAAGTDPTALRAIVRHLMVLYFVLSHMHDAGNAQRVELAIKGDPAIWGDGAAMISWHMQQLEQEGNRQFLVFRLFQIADLWRRGRAADIPKRTLDYVEQHQSQLDLPAAQRCYQRLKHTLKLPSTDQWVLRNEGLNAYSHQFYIAN
jgi:hypothetical protein